MKSRLCVVLAALSCLSIAVFPSRSASAQRCAMIEDVSNEIRNDVPDAEIRVIVGPPAARLRSGISALIGQAVPEGGSYLVARLPGAPASYVVRFVDGCATHHGRFPDRLVRAWIGGSPA